MGATSFKRWHCVGWMKEQAQGIGLFVHVVSMKGTDKGVRAICSGLTPSAKLGSGSALE